MYTNKGRKLPTFICDSGAIRTLDPRLRRALLYPAELRNQPFIAFACAKVVFFCGNCNFFAILFLNLFKHLLFKPISSLILIAIDFDGTPMGTFLLHS